MSNKVNDIWAEENPNFPIGIPQTPEGESKEYQEAEEKLYSLRDVLKVREYELKCQKNIWDSIIMMTAK